MSVKEVPVITGGDCASCTFEEVASEAIPCKQCTKTTTWTRWRVSPKSKIEAMVAADPEMSKAVKEVGADILAAEGDK